MFSLSLFFLPPQLRDIKRTAHFLLRSPQTLTCKSLELWREWGVSRAPASPLRSLHSESLRKRSLSCVNINIISVNNILIVGTNNRLFLHYTGFRAPACVFNCSVMSDSLWPLGLKPASLLCLWDFPGKNTGEGCHFLLQGILPTQRSNPCLLRWQVGSLPLSLQGSPREIHAGSQKRKKRLLGSQ